MSQNLPQGHRRLASYRRRIYLGQQQPLRRDGECDSSEQMYGSAWLKQLNTKPDCRHVKFGEEDPPALPSWWIRSC